MMDVKRLKKQINFIVEIDKLKSIARQTLLITGERHENSAEHSWHLGIMSMILSEYIDTVDIDLFRVMKMVLIHDLVEIDAGDTYCYDDKARIKSKKAERDAAIRIFNLLPEDQALEFLDLWDEFETKETIESKFGTVLDTLQPLLNNYNTQGKMWLHHNICNEQVLNRNDHTKAISSDLWDLVSNIVDDAVNKGWLRLKND